MKKKIIWIGLIVVIIAIAAYSFYASKQPVTVDMGTVEKGNIDKYIEETAIVQLENETAIYTTEGGKVLEVMAEIGQDVIADHTLLRLDDESIKLQMKNLEAQKQSILAEYAGANEPASAAEIRKLNAQVKSTEVAYQDVSRIVENNKALYESGAISMDAYQSSLSSLASSEAALEAAKSNLELAQNGVSGNVRRQYEAQLAGIQANIGLLQKRLGDLNIVSPINGIILTRNVEKGAILQPGTLIFEVGDKSGMYLESDILVDDIANVKVGSIVLIENEDLGIKAVKGVVRKIYPKAFSKMSELGIEQKRVKIEINFSNGIPDLKPGYDMNVKIITASKENTLLIDEKAIFEYQGKDHVFVNENGVANLRAIEKGLEGDDSVEVLSGLKEGERIVLSPDEKLAEGTKIK